MTLGAGRGAALARWALEWALFFVVVAGLQWRGGAFHAEFGGNPDEPAHVITGLMVRDYAASGFPARPFDFARNYYLHYPKVSLGHWPPVFYLLQAAWTIPFSASRVALILLMAAITGLLATILAELIRGNCHAVWSIGAGLVLVTLPVVQEFSQELMAELLVTVFVTLAGAAYGRFLEKESWRPAAWFGLWCSLALLTKGTGIALVPLPAMAILITGRWHLLRSRAFWLPAAVVAVLAAPWYLLATGARHQTVAADGGVAFASSRLLETLAIWGRMLSPVPAILAAVGLLLYGRRYPQGSALLLGIYLVRPFIGAFDDHHLLMGVPFLLFFASLALARLVAVAGTRARMVKLGIAACAVLLLISNLIWSPRKHYFGYSEIAQTLLDRPQFRDSVFLVCGTGEGEGMLISEVALREWRPGHYVLRSTKMLAAMDWMGSNYKVRFTQPDALQQYLDSIPVGIVVFDWWGRQSPHGKVLHSLVQSRPQQWELVTRYSGTARPGEPDGEITAYRRVGHEGRAVGRIQIDMKLFGAFTN